MTGEERDKGVGPQQESPSPEAAPLTPRAPRERQPTVTDEEELEIARLQSMSLSERPQPGTSTSLLTLANMVASSGSDGPPPERRELIGSEGRTRVSSGAPPNPGSSGRMRTAAPVKDPAAEMRDLFSLGDYTGALAKAEQILESDPRHPDAVQYAESSRGVLEQMYRARLGPLDRTPVVSVPREQLRWLSIDHRAGFLLSHVDGVSTMDVILDVSGMPRLDALRILYELLQQRVIAIR